jgi:hypothetical protein
MGRATSGCKTGALLAPECAWPALVWGIIKRLLEGGGGEQSAGRALRGSCSLCFRAAYSLIVALSTRRLGSRGRGRSSCRLRASRTLASRGEGNASLVVSAPPWTPPTCACAGGSAFSPAAPRRRALHCLPRRCAVRAVWPRCTALRQGIQAATILGSCGRSRAVPAGAPGAVACRPAGTLGRRARRGPGCCRKISRWPRSLFSLSSCMII